MSRGTAPAPASLARCTTVWLVVTLGALTLGAELGAMLRTLGTSAPWRGTFDDLLVLVAASALLGCSGWLWLVTTVTVVEVLRGRPRADTGGLTRRLVLVACGAAVMAGIGGPAIATGGTGADPADGLTGLPLPDRAVTSAPASPQADEAAPRATPAAARTSPDTVTVRPGDSLWSIAESALPSGVPPGEVDRAWRALYAANRDAIGADPDLIRAGTELITAPVVDLDPRKARP